MNHTRMKYDVAVVGGGPGGFAAAISAARHGLKTILIDRNGYIGGNAASGIPFLGFWDKHSRRTIGGFAEEVVDEFVKAGISEGHRVCPKHQSIVTFQPDHAKLIYADLCAKAGVEILLHSEMIDAKADSGRVRSVELAARGERITVEANIFVDSADGDIAYFSGAEYEKGAADGSMQPPSIIFTVTNVDESRFLKYLEDNPSEMRCYNIPYLSESRNYCYVGLMGLFNKLKDTGEWPMDIWAAIIINSPNPGQVYINGPRMGGTDATDPLEITKAELVGQQQAADFLNVLRKYIPGYEDAKLSNINSSICIRETRRVCGIKKLVIDSVMNGEIPEDSVLLGAYPVDIHGNDYSSRFIPFDGPYGVPYLTMVSKSYENLMMAGRCISCDSESYGSIRVMAQCMAMGEAVGIGASYAIKDNCPPAEVNVRKIREELLKNGAVLKVDDNDILHEKTLGI